MLYTRYSKVALIWAIALFTSLVALNNVTDYDSNYRFVSHVLRMDTTFPENKVMWRAIESPAIHHLIYGLIIVVESTIAVLCWLGGFNLVKCIRESARFQRAKGIAILGLTLGIILWFTCFITVGGEWFLMWQSETWNGQEAAFRLTVIFGLVLVYLIQPDKEPET
jgi:predicted small integral membrane protein